MKHARKDYERFQDPIGLIPEDEPVMLFRGQDKFAPIALVAYATAVGISSTSKDAQEIALLCLEHANRMLDWQNTVKQKEPDLENRGSL